MYRKILIAICLCLTALSLASCGTLSGGYVTTGVTASSARNLIDYGPEDAEEFAKQTQLVLADLREGAAQGRINSAVTLIGITSVAGYKTLTQNHTSGIAALLAAGAAVFSTRDYVLAPRFERIYSRAEAAVQCARAEYGIAKMSVDDPRAVISAQDKAASYAITSARGEIDKLSKEHPDLPVDDFRKDLEDTQRVKAAVDAHLEAPLRPQKALLFKTVHTIIAQADKQIADDQPTIAEDRSLFAGQFGQMPLPASAVSDGITAQAKVQQMVKANAEKAQANAGVAQAIAASAVTVTQSVVDALEVAADKVNLYRDAAEKLPPPKAAAVQANYTACAYEQLTGVRPRLVQQPLLLGINDADSGKTLEIAGSGKVAVALIGGTPPFSPSIANPPASDPPTVEAITLPNDMVVVKVTATDKTPEDTYQVLVKDGAGTVKQFFVKKVPKQPTGNVSQVAQSKKKAQGHK